ncbi:MAG: sigma-E factor regulatory protein RseB domain-containing protein [Candidatus Poribacteria bacterium]|nr:sigma-E factor regulatory protein RseB domain-containing protein [Candidatus Poribacteria bacterium]
MSKIKLNLIIISCLLIQATYSMAVTDESQFFDLVSRGNQMDWIGKRLTVGWTKDRCIAFESMVINKVPDIRYSRLILPYRKEANRPQTGKRSHRRRGERKEQPGRQNKPFDPRSIKIVTADILLQHQKLIRDNYQLQLVEVNESICWRDSQLWSIKPRNPDRNRLFKVWIDSETGILLRVEIKGQRNQWLSFLTQIQFDPQSILEEITQFKALEAGDKKQESRFVSRSEAEKALKRELILPERFPSGFKISQIELMDLSPTPAAHIRYTDGLETISVFQNQGRRLSRRDRRDRDLDSHDKDGSTVVPDKKRGRRNNIRKEKISDVQVTIMDRTDVHIYRWTRDSVNFTLIGSLPESEMAQIVESFINNP